MVYILIMAAALAAACYGVGMLPLSYSFSKSHLQRLSVLGTGLLLGAALGVVIPEGIGTTVAEDGKVPVQRIALCLVFGFLLMVVVEQLVTPGEHPHSADLAFKPNDPSQIEFDADIEGLKDDQSSSWHRPSTNLVPPNAPDVGVGSDRAFTLFLGLVIHAAADGLALGVANLGRNIQAGKPDPVSPVVFLAMILHKMPTSLAFSTSLLSTNISRATCQKYIAIFSAATPLSALLSYIAFTLLNSDNRKGVSGAALLVSGGSFLYAATVLLPVSHSYSSPGDMRPIHRVLLITIGVLIPLILSTVIRHGH